MNSNEALKKVRELYRLNAQRVPPKVASQRRRELYEAARELTEVDFNRLTYDQREWVIGETVPQDFTT